MRINSNLVMLRLLLLAVVAPGFESGVFADDERTNSRGTQDVAVDESSDGVVDGIRVHTVESSFQAGPTKIRVLLPDDAGSQKQRRVLYVLPVEAGDQSRFGNGLLEVKKANLHNKHGLICVSPTFSQLPWYADHPDDKHCRQESHLVKFVVPFIEKRYPAQKNVGGRLLVGFSKSGWGAYSLLLRNPDTFGNAAAWDAPLMKEQPNQFGMGPIFGTQKNFEQYEVQALLRERAKLLAQSKRLVLTGIGNFDDHHQQAHQLMTDLEIQFDFRAGPRRKHIWGSGWLPETVDLLAAED